MKVGLLTYHCANNYGACLQTFALYNSIIDNKINCKIIDFRPPQITKLHHVFEKSIHPKAIIKNIMLLPYFFPMKKRSKKFYGFYKVFFALDNKTVVTENTISNTNYDIYVCGSDQVWNPNINDGTIYLFDFVKNPSYMFSYAASFGVESLEDDVKQKYKKYLKKFNKISVREKSGQEIIKEIINKDADLVLDPTLLFAKEDWLKKFPLVESKEKYILCYFFTKEERVNEIIQYIKRITGYKLVMITNDYINRIKGDKYVRDAGPVDFLQLVYGASIVCTDSFHGTCFSMIFEKPFVTVTRKGLNTRLKNIVELVSLESKLVETVNDLNEDILSIDYVLVNKILNNKRKLSLSFLGDALNQ